jgi:putative tryptophan/tyrosine transport system substrate-binding protein
MHRVRTLLLGIAYADSFQKELREESSANPAMSKGRTWFSTWSAEGKLDLLPKLAAELVALNVDVIVAVYTPCALAARLPQR